MERVTKFILVIFLFATSFTIIQTEEAQIGVSVNLQHFKIKAEQYTKSAILLKTRIEAIKNTDSITIERAKEQLAICRNDYKNIEAFVEYFFETRIRIFNLAPVYEVEEPFMEYQSPVGMQVIEAHLFDDDVEGHKQELLSETELLYTTGTSLFQLLSEKNITDKEILESLRLELIRISTLGITGFDAPELKTGIIEAERAILAVEEYLLPYTRQKSRHSDSVIKYLHACRELLAHSRNFDNFDRLSFLTDAMLPLQEQLSKMIGESGLEINTTNTLNYSSANIFKPDALNIFGFTGDSFPDNKHLVALGKKLFFEKRLSGNGKRSCATCHAPEKYFTDGLEKSIAFNDSDRTTRNAPSLIYAAYQHGQFLDARLKSMEEQVKAVLTNPNEMNADLLVVKQLKKDKAYRRLFKDAFAENDKDELFTPANLGIAIAAYERSLPIMTSAFDKYISGNKAVLTKQQRNGFNLFMGKALCGTCHFTPLFNGLLPPMYNITELESLGLTASGHLEHPVADRDSGRYNTYPIEFYIGAFKTPTVRNVAKTGPYMHSGTFSTLEQVLDFYNKGGGKGLGLSSPYQTLSDKQLDLSKGEIEDIIEFLKALTDEPIKI